MVKTLLFDGTGAEWDSHKLRLTGTLSHTMPQGNLWNSIAHSRSTPVNITRIGAEMETK